MAKRKPAKMSTGEAVQILANESKIMKNQLYENHQAISRLDFALRDYVALFEHYIEHTKDGKSFIKKMEELVKEKVNEQKANERANGRDTDARKQDEGVGPKGVRTQQG